MQFKEFCCLQTSRRSSVSYKISNDEIIALSKVQNLDPSAHCLRLRRCINDQVEVWTPAPHELLQDLVPELGTLFLSRVCLFLSVTQIGEVARLRCRGVLSASCSSSVWLLLAPPTREVKQSVEAAL